MTYGLTAAGFVVKDQSTITTELQGAYKQVFGDNIPFGVNSVYDQLVGIHSEREADLWNLGLAIYQSQYPDTAQGAALANAGQLTGQTPEVATYSTVTLTITGTANTLIPAGSQVSIADTQTIFATTADFTIPSGGSGTTAAQATTIGAVTAPSGTLTNIVTPVNGWTSVTNAADATVGHNAETDAAFRARRALDLVVATGGSIAGVQNYLMTQLAGTTFVGVKQNSTDTTVGSLPAHSQNITIITSASDADVAQAIWNTLAGGIATTGGHSGTATDSFGNSQTVYWDVGVDVPLYLDVTITRDGTNYPANGDTLVETALENYVNGLGYGVTIQEWQLQAQLIAIAGIDAAPTIKFDRSADPTGTSNLVLAANEKPSLIGTNITMH